MDLKIHRRLANGFFSLRFLSQDIIVHFLFRGAEEFYTRSNNRTRTEGLEQAVTNDVKVAQNMNHCLLDKSPLPTCSVLNLEIFIWIRIRESVNQN